MTLASPSIRGQARKGNLGMDGPGRSGTKNEGSAAPGAAVRWRRRGKFSTKPAATASCCLRLAGPAVKLVSDIGNQPRGGCAVGRISNQSLADHFHAAFKLSLDHGVDSQFAQLGDVMRSGSARDHYYFGVKAPWRDRHSGEPCSGRAPVNTRIRALSTWAARRISSLVISPQTPWRPCAFKVAEHGMIQLYDSQRDSGRPEDAGDSFAAPSITARRRCALKAVLREVNRCGCRGRLAPGPPCAPQGKRHTGLRLGKGHRDNGARQRKIVGRL